MFCIRVGIPLKYLFLLILFIADKKNKNKSNILILEDESRGNEGWRWGRAEEKPVPHTNLMSSKSYFTFFFSNFPSTHGEYDILKIFQRWARVKEVFISGRRNRWERRSGFVIFFTVPNELRLEKELDQIYIGNMRLYVNLPKYRRNGNARDGVAPCADGKGTIHHNYAQRQPKSKEVWRKVKGKGARRNLNLKESYADSVRKFSPDQWKGPIIETTSKVLPWMSNSVVGWMIPDMNFEVLREEFIKGGMPMIKVRYMGDNLVLLTLKEGEWVEDIIKLNNNWFVSVFKDIEPRSESFVAGHKLAWVRCYSLPITMWNKDCLSKVVGEVAELITIDEATERRTWSTHAFKYGC